MFRKVPSNYAPMSPYRRCHAKVPQAGHSVRAALTTASQATVNPLTTMPNRSVMSV
jgi:hypothetical protein